MIGLQERLDVWATGVLNWIPSLLSALLTLFLFWLLWRLASRSAEAVFKRTEIDRTARTFVQTVLKYVILTVGTVSALAKVGVNTGSILTSLGVVGLTIGFAARDTLSNVISGLFIFWDRPFVIDDLVEIDGKYGRVENITLRSTRIVTPDGRMLAVPNSTIINTTVASYTNFPHLRLDIPVTVGVEENLGRARTIALSILEGDDQYMSTPPPKVIVSALNDYNVELELRVWLENEKDHIAVRALLPEKLFEAFRAAKVDMPYETLALAPVTLVTAGDTIR